MKQQVSSAERETPKKRKRSRGPRTSSPLPRQASVVPLNAQDAKASSELFQEALEKKRPKVNRESSVATNSTLAPAASLLETSPASSPPEDLESVVQKLPPSSGSADMDLSDEDVVESKLADVVVRKSPGENGSDEDVTDGEALQNAIKAALEETGAGDNDRAETIDLEIAAEKSLDAEKEPYGAKKGDGIEIIHPPRQGSGASADDAMEVDPSPSEQLEQELQLSRQAGSSQTKRRKRRLVAEAGGRVAGAGWRWKRPWKRGKTYYPEENLESGRV
ncbi:hypothetical protein NLG97_g8585 [Lecanicillium saksenae]|uniref:Uncharacterized protein n=1 Tax=Lecanicillium saksenae TaxID=468837 RepID=A0ACC1QMC8_9HYPO|nr:hypothetical protein NLG97_g8585 [Lecanicillium saksenae]